MKMYFLDTYSDRPKLHEVEVKLSPEHFSDAPIYITCNHSVFGGMGAKITESRDCRLSREEAIAEGLKHLTQQCNDILDNLARILNKIKIIKTL